MKYTLGLIDASLALFPSFSPIKLYPQGNEYPKLEGKYCCTGVASWTRKSFKES
jgi:hypothetical protein